MHILMVAMTTWLIQTHNQDSKWRDLSEIHSIPIGHVFICFHFNNLIIFLISLFIFCLQYQTKVIYLRMIMPYIDSGWMTVPFLWVEKQNLISKENNYTQGMVWSLLGGGKEYCKRNEQ